MPKPSVYLDAAIWIAHHKPKEVHTPERRAAMNQIFDDIHDGLYLAVASSLILIEALSVEIADIELALDGRKGIMVAADEEITRRARELQSKCHKETKRVLSNLDAIHLSTASVMGCQRFITLDQRRKNNELSPIADRALLERLLGIKILSPEEVTDQGRFDFEETT